MKSILVCIAKNEDLYIDEWLQYNLKLGFDNILVFQNNWKYSGNIKDCRVILTDWKYSMPGAQSLAYNTFISHMSSGYDFAAFFDIDEFLTLKQHKSVNSFLEDYQDYDAVAVNWRIFGSNGLTGDEDIGYSVLNRFTRCSKTLNKHVKVIANLNRIDKTKQFFQSYCPHYSLKSAACDSTINVSKHHYVHGPYNEFDIDICMQIAYLNHYRNKTQKEAMHKCYTNATGFNSHLPYLKNFINAFNQHDMNEVEDTTARDCFCQ